MKLSNQKIETSKNNWKNLDKISIWNLKKVGVNVSADTTDINSLTPLNVIFHCGCWIVFIVLAATSTQNTLADILIPD